jgi:Na+-transporting methylmalonyl-CoA/oxaloacetate decarboxylase gamma subunit
MLGCTLPEFALTSVSDILGDVTYKPNIATFYPLLSAFSAIIVFGFGIVFLVKFIKFINCVSISKPIEFSLSSSYLEKRERLAQIYSFRFVCLSMSLLTFATLFGADLFIDNKNMLPDIFSALLFLASAGVMKRFSSRAKLPIILSIFYAFSSLCTTFAQSNFVNNYDYMDISKITAAKRCYDLVIASSAMEFLFLSLTLLSFAYCLSDAVKKTTGSPNANESAQKYNNELHRSFKVQSFIMAIFGMIASASTVVYIYLLSYTERVAVLPEYSDVEVTMQKYGEFWIVVAILCIVWLVYTYRLAHAVKEAAEARFEIEN